MRIVKGRGNSRIVYDVPCATIIKRGSDDTVKLFVSNVCELLGIK